jgi:hypothetical protein
MLQTMLGYKCDKDNISITDINSWTDFTRRVCFFGSTANQDIYKKIMPSDSALIFHLLRGELVTTIALDSCRAFSKSHENVGEGWTVDDNKHVSVKWDNDVENVRKLLHSKKKIQMVHCNCEKGDRCSGFGRGCKNCAKACRPCNKTCNCKADCRNPHNNGGFCKLCEKSKTQTQTSVDTEEIEDSKFDNIEFDIDGHQGIYDYVHNNDDKFLGFDEYFQDTDQIEDYLDLPTVLDVDEPMPPDELLYVTDLVNRPLAEADIQIIMDNLHQSILM